MKRMYQKPKAVMVEYSYESNVVASSVTCSGSHWVFQEPTGCAKYRYTDYQKTRSTAHPCDWDTSEHPFATP